MTSSNRIESNFARVFPYVNVFFVETIFQIGSFVPEILFKNCYLRPPSDFMKGIFNALIIKSVKPAYVRSDSVLFEGKKRLNLADTIELIRVSEVLECAVVV